MASAIPRQLDPLGSGRRVPRHADGRQLCRSGDAYRSRAGRRIQLLQRRRAARYENARWGTRLQNRSVPMEPDRDERMPWSGHPAKTSESEGWVFNVARFYEHFLHNYRVHQGEDGSLQEILPPYWTFNSKDIVWPSVATIIPDWYYNFYGDDRLLRDNYQMMKRFVLYHERANLRADGTLDFCTYGDWVDSASMGSNSQNFGATSRPLIGTAYFFNNCRIVERAARLLGNAD